VHHQAGGGESRISVMVVDDHQTFADLLVIALESKPDLYCVGAATTAAEALALARRTRPDVVIMDIQLGRDNGLDAARDILAERPETVIVIVTAHTDPDWLAKAAQAGASAFVSKSGSLKDMLSAIRDAKNGSMLVAQSLFQRPPERRGSSAEVVGLLTARERDVLTMMGRGAATSEIARSLNISLHTCRGYVKAVHLKLGVRSQLEAVVKAHRLGLITVSSDG
jgi:DNA-binding NarL/FixJ family response regulator